MSSPTLVQRAQSHLRSVIDAPQTKLDTGLLDRVRLESVHSISKDERTSLISLVVELLQTIQQDPSPATKLAEELVKPYTFSDVLSLQPPVDLIAGLKAPAPAIQLLVLQLLILAAKNLGDVGIVAGSPELVATLVDSWLRTSDITVAETARQVIVALALAESRLQQSSASPSALAETSQHGLMQRRLFKDKHVYGLFYSLTSLTTTGQPGQLPKREKTLAQGRLLDLLKDLWRLPEVWQSQIPDVEQTCGLRPGEGLLHYAALQMVEKSDIILRVTQFDFFTDLIGSVNRSQNPEAASAQLLEFLKATVHKELFAIYTTPEKQDSVDISFYYAPAARYLAAYVASYSDTFLADSAARSQVFKRLHEVLDSVPNSQWARNDGPGSDLHMLASVPRLALIPETALVLALPTRPPSADIYRTLAHLFSGRTTNSNPPQEIRYPPLEGTDGTDITIKARSQAHDIAEQWTARYLFLKYINQHSNFWRNLVDAGSVTAFKDTAVAAIDLVTTIVQAQWQTDPGETQVHDIDLRAAAVTIEHQGWYGSQPPANGIAAVIHPQALDVLLPFVMKGPGSAGVALLGADTESSAYHIFQAKLRLTAALEDGIREAASRMADDQEEKTMLVDLAAGLSGLRRQGLNRRQEPGVEVGTMEL